MNKLIIVGIIIAIVVIVGGLSLGLETNFSNSPDLATEDIVPKGNTYTINLSDGIGSTSSP